MPNRGPNPDGGAWCWRSSSDGKVHCTPYRSWDGATGRYLGVWTPGAYPGVYEPGHIDTGSGGQPAPPSPPPTTGSPTPPTTGSTPPAQGETAPAPGVPSPNQKGPNSDPRSPYPDDIPPSERECGPAMAEPPADSYEGKYRRNFRDQLKEPLVAGLFPLAVYDSAEEGASPTYNFQPVIKTDTKGAIRLLVPGRGPGSLVFAPGGLVDRHITGRHPSGSTYSESSFLILSGTTGVGNPYGNILSFGEWLPTTQRPGNGAYFKRDPNTGNLRLQFTDSTGADDNKASLKINNMLFPNSDGSANQVLTTNGSGVLSWGTPSGGAAVADNRLVRGDSGTGVQGSGITVDDSDNVTNVESLSIAQATAGALVREVKTNGVIIYREYQNELDTIAESGTTAETGTLHTFSMASDGTYTIEATIIGRVDAGSEHSDQTTGNGCAFNVRAAYRRVGGTVTKIGTTLTVLDRQDFAGIGAATADFGSPSGNNVALNVTGVNAALSPIEPYVDQYHWQMTSGKIHGPV